MIKFIKKLLSCIIIVLLGCLIACNGSQEEGNPLDKVAYIKNGDSKITSFFGLVGEEYSFEFGIENQTDVNAIWTSSNDSILTVSVADLTKSNLATVKCESAGKATITATSSDGATASIEITSVSGEISSSISENQTIVLYMKENQNTFDFGSTITSNTTDFDITYSVNNNNVEVDNNGIITAKCVGESIVKAKLGSSDNLTCQVKIDVKAILQTSSEKVIIYNDSFDEPYNYVNTITCYPIDSEIVYEFSSENISLDDNGNIVSSMSGNYTITARIKDLPDYYVITEVEVKPSRMFNITSNNIVLKVGEETPIPISTTFNDLNYQVNNSFLAKIENNKIIALRSGSTVIKIFRNDIELGSINLDIITETPNAVRLSKNYKNMEYVNVFGRNYYDSEQNSVIMSYGGAGFEVKFCGTELSASFVTRLNSESLYMQVLVDGEQVSYNAQNILEGAIAVKSASLRKYTIVENLPYGVHTVKVLRRSMYNSGEIGLTDIETDGFLLPAPKKSKLKIDIYGDSITAGYGVCDGVGWNSANSNGLLTYGYLLTEKLGAQSNMMGHSGWGVYVSTGNNLNPETQWYDKIDIIAESNKTWDLEDFIPDLVIINLGTNDASGVTGKYNSAEFISKYKTMIESILEKSPNAYVLLCYGMMGKNATVDNDIKQVVKQLNNEKVVYLPLENYGCWNSSGLNGHPTPEGNEKAAEFLYDYIVANYPDLIKLSHEEEFVYDYFDNSKDTLVCFDNVANVL